MSDHTKTNLITLTRHVFTDQVENHKEASGDLTLLLTAIQLGCKFVASNVRKASLISMYVSLSRPLCFLFSFVFLYPISPASLALSFSLFLFNEFYENKHPCQSPMRLNGNNGELE